MAYNYEFIDKSHPEIKKAYNNLLELLHLVQDDLRDEFTFRYQIVGSYSRNLMTYQPNTNQGYDFDFNLYPNDKYEYYTAEEIKTKLMNSFRKFCGRFGYSRVENSTRVITIKTIDHWNSRIVRSADFAIVYDYEKKGKMHQQYIRFNKETNGFAWVEQGEGFYNLDKKISWIKSQNLWEQLKAQYLDKKNYNTDPDAHSRSLFALAVNDICMMYHYQNKKK